MTEKTCGNCWYYNPTKKHCSAQVPLWVKQLDIEKKLDISDIQMPEDTDATTCDTWHVRPEQHKDILTFILGQMKYANFEEIQEATGLEEDKVKQVLSGLRKESLVCALAQACTDDYDSEGPNYILTDQGKKHYRDLCKKNHFGEKTYKR
jgi:hypothetical protein